jgi:hypothetical protein
MCKRPFQQGGLLVSVQAVSECWASHGPGVSMALNSTGQLPLLDETRSPSHQDVPVIFDLGHVCSACGRLSRREGVCVVKRDLHTGTLIILPLRRAIGNSNLGRFHVLWQMVDPTRRWHSDYACNFAHADRKDSELCGHTSIDQCRSSGRWINRGHVIMSQCRGWDAPFSLAMVMNMDIPCVSCLD